MANLACKDTIVGTSEADKIVFPDSNVSYAKHVDPLFRLRCAFPGCHGSDTKAVRGFSLDSYANLMFGDRQPVLRGDPENSPLAWRIEGGTGTGVRMPLNSTPLKENQIQGIKTWIRENAQDN
jgi:hypothetical protein